MSSRPSAGRRAAIRRLTPACSITSGIFFAEIAASEGVQRLRAGAGSASMSRAWRCEKWLVDGDGVLKIEMGIFLPAVYVTCEACNGKRPDREDLRDRLQGQEHRGRAGHDAVDEGVDFFRAVPKIYDPLATSGEVGLGYIHLGQQATTLSGGEAQRVKAGNLSWRARRRGKTFYIHGRSPPPGCIFTTWRSCSRYCLDYGTRANTLLVIEHNLVS